MITLTIDDIVNHDTLTNEEKENVTTFMKERQLDNLNESPKEVSNKAE